MVSAQQVHTRLHTQTELVLGTPLATLPRRSLRSGRCTVAGYCCLIITIVIIISHLLSLWMTVVSQSDAVGSIVELVLICMIVIMVLLIVWPVILIIIVIVSGGVNSGAIGFLPFLLLDLFGTDVLRSQSTECA